MFLHAALSLKMGVGHQRHPAHSAADLQISAWFSVMYLSRIFSRSLRCLKLECFQACATHCFTVFTCTGTLSWHKTVECWGASYRHEVIPVQLYELPLLLLPPAASSWPACCPRMLWWPDHSRAQSLLRLSCCHCSLVRLQARLLHHIKQESS